MCKAHRCIVAATITAWMLALSLIIAVHPASDHWLRIPTILVGVAAVVLSPYAAYPWLMKSMLEQQRTELEQQLMDYHGAFLAGWESAKEPPKRTTRRLEAV